MSLAATILIYIMTIILSSFAFFIAGEGQYKLTTKIGISFAIGQSLLFRSVGAADYFCSYLDSINEDKI